MLMAHQAESLPGGENKPHELEDSQQPQHTQEAQIEFNNECKVEGHDDKKIEQCHRRQRIAQGREALTLVAGRETTAEQAQNIFTGEDDDGYFIEEREFPMERFVNVFMMFEKDRDNAHDDERHDEAVEPDMQTRRIRRLEHDAIQFVSQASDPALWRLDILDLRHARLPNNKSRATAAHRPSSGEKRRTH